MTKQFACHYSIARFAPYPETDEFVNVGVVLACPAIGYLDFKRADLHRRGRVGRFFPELDANIYSAAMHAWVDSVTAYRSVPEAPQILTAIERKQRRDVFKALVRPRAGKDAMFFNVDDGFFFGEPLRGRYEVEVRVVYFDSGRGQWALVYDAIDAPRKTALAVTKQDTGRWQEARVTLRDAFFGNRGERGADLALVNRDADDDTFHLIEITRKTGDRKGVWGD